MTEPASEKRRKAGRGSETPSSDNFAFMQSYEPQFDRLGALAERYFSDDPNTCLIKLRQFAELLAQEVAARSGFFSSTEEPQSELLRRLKAERVVPPPVMDLFHQVRIAGNRATHDGADDHGLALTTLKITHQLAVWFHRSFGRHEKFNPGPFVPPSPPDDSATPLKEELEHLRSALDATRSETERVRQAAEEARKERETAEERAQREAADRATWEELAQEAEAARSALAAQLQALQVTSTAAPAQQKAETLAFVEKAAWTCHGLVPLL